MATIKGRIVYVYPTQQMTSKSGNQFQKRDFVFAVQSFDPDTGESTVDEENTPMLSVTGERCAQLDRFRPGDNISVTYSLRGRRYRRDDGKESIINDIDVRSVRGEFQPVPSQPVAPPQPAPQAQAHPQEKPENNDDLPF